LGRPLSQTTSVQVNVIEPGTVYTERLHQLDLRVTKILKFGEDAGESESRRLQCSQQQRTLNFPAAFNPANPVQWERPGVIMPARLAKFSFQADF